MSENSPAFVLGRKGCDPNGSPGHALSYSPVRMTSLVHSHKHRQRRISEDTLERINRQEKVIEAPNH